MFQQDESDSRHYISIKEIIDGYTPKIKLSSNILNEIFEEYSPIEEGETILIGSHFDWVLLVSRIIEKYENENNNSIIQLDITTLKKEESQQKGVFNEFMSRIIEQEVSDNTLISILGYQNQFEKIYHLLKLYDKDIIQIYSSTEIKD